MDRRRERFLVALSGSERQALLRLSEQAGTSSADILRRLLRLEAYRWGLLPNPNRIKVDEAMNHDDSV